MLLIITKAQRQLREYAKARRLAVGLTQQGLALRSGVKLPTLRKFEQTGLISLESFLKLLMVLGGLDSLVNSVKPEQKKFSFIDEILSINEKTPKRGWRT